MSRPLPIHWRRRHLTRRARNPGAYLFALWRVEQAVRAGRCLPRRSA